MRFIVPLIFGLAGFAVLVALGLWQLQRMEWKHGMVAAIEARIGAEPVPLPETVEEAADNFTPVVLTGTVDGDPLRVLGAWRGGGSGYRIVAPVLTEGRRVMVDLGVVPLDGAADLVLPQTALAITGTLNWPDDHNAGTPEPDGLDWYAREVGPMATALDTEPLMVVATQVEPPLPVTPIPVGVEGIPDNHLGYAIQWFGLAAVWLGMTLFLLWRIRRRTL